MYFTPYRVTINTKVNHHPLWCFYAFSSSPMIVGVTKLCSFVRWLGSVGKNGRIVKLPNIDNVDQGQLANLGWSAKAPKTEDGCQCLLYEMEMEILIVVGWVGCHETTKGLNLRPPMLKFQVIPHKIKHVGVVRLLFLIKHLYFIRVVLGEDRRTNVRKTCSRKRLDYNHVFISYEVHRLSESVHVIIQTYAMQ